MPRATRPFPIRRVWPTPTNHWMALNEKRTGVSPLSLTLLTRMRYSLLDSRHSSFGKFRPFRVSVAMSAFHPLRTFPLVQSYVRFAPKIGRRRSTTGYLKPDGPLFRFIFLKRRQGWVVNAHWSEAEINLALRVNVPPNQISVSYNVLFTPEIFLAVDFAACITFIEVVDC
jgi:hypothetical protein